MASTIGMERPLLGTQTGLSSGTKTERSCKYRMNGCTDELDQLALGKQKAQEATPEGNLPYMVGGKEPVMARLL